MATVAELLAAELETLTGKEFADCGTQVSADLRESELAVVETLSAIPQASRILLTDHDSFGYFAEKYDFEIVGVVIPGGSTLGDASSGDLAALIETIEARNVPAIFGNSASSPALLETLATEVGSDVQVVELLVGSLGDEASGGDTYRGMMELNATRIAQALAN
jgi:zinc/manganese transport system substrate-binding protein